MIMSISIGFLIFDEIMIKVFWNNPNADKLTAQMSMHHWLAAAYFASAFIVGYAVPSSISVGLVCEISTFFANLVDLI